MKTFNDWYNLIQEGMAEPSAEVSEPTVDQTTADTTTQNTTSNRDVIINDVDSIMTSLETLSSELKESLKLDENGLASAGAAVAGAAAVTGLAKGAKMLYDAKVKAPKARKEQAKVNAMNVKIAGVESTISSADKDQKEKLKAKLDAVKSSRDDLQKAIEDRYSDSSKVVKRAIAVEKTKGKMEVLKVHMGDATPEQQKEIKNQLAKLKIKSAEDTKNLQQIVNDVKDNTSSEDAAAVKNLNKDNKDNTEADRVAKIENDINTYAKNIDETNAKIKEYETKIRQLQAEMEKATDKQKFEDGIAALQKRIEADKEDVKDMQATRNNLKKELAKIAPKESLVIRAADLGLHELATEILEKESWQLNNTILYNTYNEQLTRMEFNQILNESKYITNSIKDRFFKLL